jgi:hypothetical protein
VTKWTMLSGTSMTVLWDYVQIVEFLNSPYAHWKKTRLLITVSSGNAVATQDRVFPHYVPNSSIKHSKSDSKDCSQEIL